MAEITPLEVDFSQLKTPDILGDYANAFQAGRSLARRADAQNAFGPTNARQGAGPASQPDAVGDNAMTGPPVAPPGAAPLGDQIAAMSAPQRLAAARQAEKLAAVGIGLRNLAYGERQAVLAHLGPVLARNGLDPSAMAAFDPTDANLDAQVTTALNLERTLATGSGGAGPAPPAFSRPPEAGV